MTNKKFYITTPIYYGNGVPHIGHFYTSLIADTINKYQKISGFDTKFTTGIDENSQKIVQKADELGRDVMDYLDEMAKKHKETWDFFEFDYTDFIRTTSPRHKKLVQEVLQTCFDRGDIYEGEYEGMYCVGCESFKKDEDLVFLNKITSETFPITPKVKSSENIEKVCPDHLKAPDQIKEKNYFFKLSKYQTWLEEFYKASPNFVAPDFRYNEVKAFVERGLEDFSISRETNTFGIPLPFDESQVTYVWFDALFNYWTSLKYSPVNQKISTNISGTSDKLSESQSVIGGVFGRSERINSGNEREKDDICNDSVSSTQGQIEKNSPHPNGHPPHGEGTKGGENFEDKTDFWIGEESERKIMHIVGKDIIRFHAIYWPAMLASYFDLGEEKDGALHFSENDKKYLPTEILVNGYFTVDGQKMSKSLGNVIEPIEYSKKYSKDLLTLYMLSAFTIGRDGDYDRNDAILNYNAKLANNFGNLVNRAVVLTMKLNTPPSVPPLVGEGSSNGAIFLPERGKLKGGIIDPDILEKLEIYEKDFMASMEKYALKEALDVSFRFLDELNLYVTEKEPWNLMRDEEKQKETQQVLYTICESLRRAGLNLYSFFPEKMGKLFESLGLQNYLSELENGKLSELKNKKEVFDIREKKAILFEKFDLEK